MKPTKYPLTNEIPRTFPLKTNLIPDVWHYSIWDGRRWCILLDNGLVFFRISLPHQLTLILHANVLCAINKQHVHHTHSCTWLRCKCASSGESYQFITADSSYFLQWFVSSWHDTWFARQTCELGRQTDVKRTSDIRHSDVGTMLAELSLSSGQETRQYLGLTTFSTCRFAFCLTCSRNAKTACTVIKWVDDYQRQRFATPWTNALKMEEVCTRTHMHANNFAIRDIVAIWRMCWQNKQTAIRLEYDSITSIYALQMLLMRVIYMFMDTFVTI